MLPKNGLVHRTIEQNLFFFLGGEGCVVVSRLANKAFEIRPKKKKSDHDSACFSNLCYTRSNGLKAFLFWTFHLLLLQVSGVSSKS